jgi:predicted RNase H-like nuclease (RuvC/YqgF family)
MGNYFFNKIPSMLPAIPVATFNTIYVTAPSLATTRHIEEVDEDDEAVENLEDQIQALTMMASDLKRQFEEIEASIFELNKKKNDYN